MDKLVSKSNILLLKDDVGKAKPASFQLPAVEFCYGRNKDIKQEGAGDIVRSWKLHNRSSIPRDTIPIDFKKVNKYGAGHFGAGHQETMMKVNVSCNYLHLQFLTFHFGTGSAKTR